MPCVRVRVLCACSGLEVVGRHLDTISLSDTPGNVVNPIPVYTVHGVVQVLHACTMYMVRCVHVHTCTMYVYVYVHVCCTCVCVYILYIL